MRPKVVWMLMTAFCTDLPFHCGINAVMGKEHYVQDRKLSKTEEGSIHTNENIMAPPRHKRSASNDSTSGSNTESSQSAIEEFYSDPNNRAMYLVLPIIILIYGGCSSLYCINKCRLYLIRRRIRAERAKKRRERERMSSDVFRFDNETTKSPSPPNTIERSKSMVDMQREKSNKPVVRPFSSIPVFSVEKINPAFVRSDTEDNLTLDDIENNQDEDIELEVSEFDVKPKTKTPEKQIVEVSLTQPPPDIEKEGSIEDLTEPLQDIEEKADKKGKEISFVENERESSVMIANETILTTEKTTDSEALKPSKQLANLSLEEVAEILSYYGEKKHMPDVIPEDEENAVPLKKKVKKWKHRVFNS